MPEGAAKQTEWDKSEAKSHLKKRNRWLGGIFLLVVLGIIVLSFVIFTKHGFPPH